MVDYINGVLMLQLWVYVLAETSLATRTSGDNTARTR